MIRIAVTLCLLARLVLSSPVLNLQNITIAVPEGTTNHGNPNLLCFPTKAWDIIVFFLGNYVAHTATTITDPGASLFDSLLNRLLVLLVPFLGIYKGVRCIYQAAAAARFKETPLQTALRSSALCEVIRNASWKPQDGDVIRNLKIPQEVVEELLSNSLNPQLQNEESCHTGKGKLEGQQHPSPALRAEIKSSPLRAEIKSSPLGHRIFEPDTKSNVMGRQVHGICELPDGYSVAIFPTQSTMEPASAPGSGPSASNSPSPPMREANEYDWELSCSSSIIKPLVSIIQLFYGCLTLYRARGDQVKQYGYSAFGLTVTPYVTMSFINLCGAFLTPSYSHMYLFSTMIKDEAQKRTDGHFEGVIGSVPKSSDHGHYESVQGRFTGIFEVNNQGEHKLRLYKPNPCLQKNDDDAANGSAPQRDMKNDDFTHNFVMVEFPGEENKSERDKSKHSRILEIPTCQHLERSHNEKFRDIVLLLITTLIGLIPIAAVGGFSHFQPGNSSPSQRGWIMAWFTVGVGASLVSYLYVWMGNEWIKQHIVLNVLFILVLSSMVYIPGIGGFIVVGKMIHEYGTCSLVS